MKSLISNRWVRIHAVATALVFVYSTAGWAETYYVDSIDGDDANSGLAESSAWKSLEKVNGWTFNPGDRILFRAGASWTGQLWPKGSGTESSPIIVDRYGADAFPHIDGAGKVSEVVYLYNQSFWEINNLEITNDAPEPGDRRGVLIKAENYGIMRHIYLKHLYIHNIKGIIGQSIKAKVTGGIGFWEAADDVKDTRFDDILVDSCTIHTVDNTGLYTIGARGGRANDPSSPDWYRRRITNLHIRNNVIHDVAKNAMIIRMADGGVVEYNVCYNTAYRTGTGNTIFSRSCDGTVFQYNEGYLNRTKAHDGCLYDADLNSPNTVWQYSYSHDNNHGLIWFCTVKTDSGVIVRYNISQNDKGRLIALRYDFAGADIYNNVFFIPSWLSPVIIHEKPGRTQKYGFYNNIIYNMSPTARYEFANADRTIDYNVFYGYHPDGEPDDPHKITADPRFVAPGTARLGIHTTGGYKLLPDSPCIDSGKAIENNGGKDFFGNPLYAGKPDRGVHERPRNRFGYLGVARHN
ncbi:MAG: hypothetical protein J7M12_05245 [Candidatus Hydrogenedentes bacterium]|nr:hypothetical protein [Candidatus Hydrogenedentota bacterium]